jgi:hypothetical protein
LKKLRYSGNVPQICSADILQKGLSGDILQTLLANAAKLFCCQAVLRSVGNLEYWVETF